MKKIIVLKISKLLTKDIKYVYHNVYYHYSSFILYIILFEYIHK